MTNYLLYNYKLSPCQFFSSLLVSEPGLRHLAQAECDQSRKWGHRIIGAIELCPGIGLVATIVEAIVVQNIHKTSQPPNEGEVLFIGSQDKCEGVFVENEAREICQRLQRGAPSAIRFNRQLLRDNVLDGTCTAMSLKFLHLYRTGRGELNLSTPGELAMLISGLQPNFLSSSLEMRTRQSAYDTIEVQSSSPAHTQENLFPQNSPLLSSFLREVGSAAVNDFSLQKIQALAMDYKFVINNSSDIINVNELSRESLLSTINSFRNGEFIIRAIKPFNNRKLEERGHSLVYIKEPGFSCLYDPNFGAQAFISHDACVEVLFSRLNDCLKDFETNQVRFYHLQSS